MDATLAYVIVALVFAGVIVYAITRYQRSSGEVKTVLGGFKVEGSNPPPAAPAPRSAPGVRVKDADVGRDAKVRDGTGQGADVERIKTGGNLDVSSENPDTKA